MLSQLLSDLRYRLRAITRRDDLERELADELQFHVDRETDKLERAGIPHDEARRQARLAFGGVDRAKEESRDGRGTVLLETTLQDLRYAARGLRARPGFTLGVVITLGLGIGANAAMFGVVDRLLLRPPAFLRDADRVHRIYQTRTRRGVDDTDGTTRFPRYKDLERLTSSFSSIVAFSTTELAIGDGEDSRVRVITAANVSYFDLFDIHPVLGRFFTKDEDVAPKGAPVVVLGYEYWQSQYGGRADAIGQHVRVGRTICTIIGVAPAGFIGVADSGVPVMYVPFTTFAWDQRGSDIRPNYDYTKNYDWFWLELLAKRKEGVTIAAADADLTRALQESWRIELGSNADAALKIARPRANLGPVLIARGPEAGPQAKVVVWVTGVALIVLLIACANVANLLLGRAVTRRREIALRLALGVSRSRLIRQLLTESLLLALIGGVIGLAVAQWGGGVLRALFLPPDFGAAVITDGRTLALAFVATVTAALLTGVAPIAQALRYSLTQTLNAGGRAAGESRSLVRTGLLLFQSTLSVVLLVGAGLFVRSLHNARSIHLGFDVDPIVVITENSRGGKRTDAERIDLERRLAALAMTVPGVVTATPSPAIPYWGYEGRSLFVPGVDSVDGLGTFFLQAGDANFFKTYGTRILRGRAFEDSDGPDAAPVIIVSEGMAKALWPAADPMGKCVRIETATAPCRVVVGVSEEMHINALREATTASGEPRHEYTYTLPIGQYPEPAGMLAVRVAGNASDYTEAVRRQLQTIMPGSSFVTADPLRSMLDPRMQSWRTGATMFVAFAVLALTLAAVGLYSVIAYGVMQRRQEIGVRLALGASGGHVMRLVIGSGVRLVVLGVLLGCSTALLAGRWIQGLLFNESPNDPLVYGIVAVVLIAVALMATSIPGLAAARVDPNIAMRAD